MTTFPCGQAASYHRHRSTGGLVALIGRGTPSDPPALWNMILHITLFVNVWVWYLFICYVTDPHCENRSFIFSQFQATAQGGIICLRLTRDQSVLLQFIVFTSTIQWARCYRSLHVHLPFISPKMTGAVVVVVACESIEAECVKIFYFLVLEVGAPFVCENKLPLWSLWHVYSVRHLGNT